MKKVLWCAAIVVALAVAGGCSTEEPAAKYGIIWQDEFEGPAGQLPDAAKWQFDEGTDWGRKLPQNPNISNGELSANQPATHAL